jgi:beta-exotoxin I transport system permease protein
MRHDLLDRPVAAPATSERPAGHHRRARTPRLHSIFERTLHDERRSLVAWCVGLVVYTSYLVAVFPTVRGNPDMQRIAEEFPESLRQMLFMRDFTTGPGYLQAEAFSMILPLLLVIVAVLNASDATSGEEERRTVDLLLANPIRRRRVVVEKFLATTVYLGLVTLSLFTALVVFGSFVGLDVAVSRIAAVCLVTWLLALGFGAVALAVGAATGRRGVARGVTVAVVLASYLVTSLADLVPALKVARPLSLFSHSIGTEPIYEGLSLGHTAVLVVAIVTLVGLAAWAFERRDLTS